MIGLDTNLLVRIITSDDPEQTEAAKRFIGENCTAQDRGFINAVVLCELAWSLKRSYGFDWKAVASAIDGILANPVLEVESPALVASALKLLRSEGLGFSDLLVAEINRANGCATTATFDRKAAKHKGFTLIR